MVTIGARVPHEDAEFISQLKIEGAKTPSDKMRAIVSEARRRHQGMNDYKKCLEVTNSFVEPFNSKVLHLEMENDTHSELIIRTLEWLPEAMAFIMSSKQRLDDDNINDVMINIEKGFVDRVFRLMESILQMGVTRRSSCYNEDAILDRVEPVMELVRVIEQTLALKKKEKK